jgi:uncharacterized membrane protein YqjE
MPHLEHIAHTLVAQLRNRLELLSVEWQEEKLRIRNLLLSLLLLLFFVQLAIVMVIIALVVAYWETPARIPIIWFGAALFGGAAYLSWRALRATITDTTQAFRDTVDQIKADERALHHPAPPR